MDKVQEKLMEMLAAPFDPHLRLCSAYLARWKCEAYDAFGTVAREWQRETLYNCVNHAAEVSSDGFDMMVRVLDDLQPDFKARRHLDAVHFPPDPWFGENIVSFTVVLGVKEYVKKKVGHGQGCVVSSSSVYVPGHVADYTTPFLKFYHDQGESLDWPLLLDAFLAGHRPIPEMVSLLLKNGADPNIIIRGATGEMNALDEVVSELRSESISIDQGPVCTAWRESLCLLLRYGAKPKRADVEYLREFIGEDVIHKLKLPHLGRHRVFMSKHFTRLA